MNRLLLALCALLIATPALAGSMTLMGVGKPPGGGGGGGGGSTSAYVAGSFASADLSGNSSQTVNFDTTNAVAGDILIVGWNDNQSVSDWLTTIGPPSVAGSGAALTELVWKLWLTANGNCNSAGCQSAILWKVLTTADLTGGGAHTGQLTIPNYTTGDTIHYTASVWHGGSTLTNPCSCLYQSANATDTRITATGYAQAGGTSLFISYMRINGSSVTGTYLPPTPFTSTPVSTQFCCGTGAANDYIATAGTTNITSTSYVFDGFAADNPLLGGHAGQAGYLLQIQ